MKTSTWLGIGVAVTALWLVALIAVWNRKQPVRVSTPDRPSVPAAFDPSDHGYAGWQACSECHAKRVDEFRETRHFQAIRLAERAEFPKGFSEGSNVFEPRDSPVRFEMSAQSSGATISTLPVNSTRLERAVSQVDFIYGSGAGTDEVYFTRRGDALYELPAVWLHHQECWGTSPFDPHGTGDFARPLAPQCLECHNTWIDYHRGTLNEYGKLEPQLLGVTCERCHGPAKSHADFHRSHPDERVAAHIVRPKTLSRDRQMDLCAQCHTNAVRYRRPPFSFRAGEDLAQYFRILEMRYPEDDRVANQTRYLKESRCYQRSETLTCIT